MSLIHPNVKINILSAGRAWPKSKAITNLDLLLRHPETKEKSLSVLKELDFRITRGFGFSQRYLAHFPDEPLRSNEETSESLALQAVQKVFEGLKLPQPDAFVLGSTTSSRYTGSQATSILGKLGLQLPAYEMKAGCSTSLASLHFAQALLSFGYKNVLVSCAETLSKVIHPEVRETWFGLADGAAALYLEADPQNGEIEILKSFYSTDGRFVDLYTTPGVLPPHREELEKKGYFLSGDSSHLKEIAKDKYLSMIQNLLPTQSDRDAVSWIIPHQVNRLLIDEVCRESQLNGEILWSADQYGNLGGSSVLFTLAEAIEKRRFKKNDQVLLMSVGGGLSFAAQLWQIHGKIEN